jgi:hypothetical protein
MAYIRAQPTIPINIASINLAHLYPITVIFKIATPQNRKIDSGNRTQVANNRGNNYKQHTKIKATK